jgi:hypothetical protein
MVGWLPAAPKLLKRSLVPGRSCRRGRRPLQLHEIFFDFTIPTSMMTAVFQTVGVASSFAKASEDETLQLLVG